MTNASFKRASAHEGDGRDLDDVLLQIAIDLVGLEHVVKRVVQRAQIGIDLLLQRSRQEAQALAGFDRRTRQHDAIHALRHQRSDSHGDGQIRLAGAGGANAEDHVVLFDGFQIAALVDALGLDRALAKGALLAGFGQTAQGGCPVGGQDANHGAQISVDEAVSVAQQVLIVGKHLLDPADVAGRAGDLDGVGAQVDGDIQTIFQQAQVFVAGTKQGFDIRADFNVLLHLGSEDSLRLCWSLPFAA